MTSISVEQAQSDLPKIISNLKVAETVVITEHGIPVARLSSEIHQPRTNASPEVQSDDSPSFPRTTSI